MFVLSGLLASLVFNLVARLAIVSYDRLVLATLV